MIKPEQYKIFFNLVTEELEGDWVVIGGSMLALVNANARVTADIDMCCMDELTNEKRILLMNLAQQAGLSIESINPAADFFLKQIPHWKSALVLLKAGQKGNLYRPSLELYIDLKLRRYTAVDVEDCISFIQWNKRNNIEINNGKIIKLIQQHGQSHHKSNDEILKLISYLN